MGQLINPTNCKQSVMLYRCHDGYVLFIRSWKQGMKAQLFGRLAPMCILHVFNPLALSNLCLPLPQFFRNHKRQERMAYEQIVREVDHGSFTPLALAAMVAWERQP